MNTNKRLLLVTLVINDPLELLPRLQALQKILHRQKSEKSLTFRPYHPLANFVFQKVPWNLFSYPLICNSLEKSITIKFAITTAMTTTFPPSNLHQKFFLRLFRRRRTSSVFEKEGKKIHHQKMVKNASFLSMSRTNMLNQGSSASSLPPNYNISSSRNSSLLNDPFWTPLVTPSPLSDTPPLKMIFWWGSLAYNQSIILLGK